MTEISEDESTVPRTIRPSEAVKAYEAIEKSAVKIVAEKAKAWTNWTHTIGPFIRVRTDNAKREARGTRGTKYAAAVQKQMAAFYPTFRKLSDNGTVSYLLRIMDSLEAVNTWRNRLPDDERPTSPMRVWQAYEGSLLSSPVFVDAPASATYDTGASSRQSMPPHKAAASPKAAAAPPPDEPLPNAPLSKTATERLEAYKRHVKRELEREFEDRVLKEAEARVTGALRLALDQTARLREEVTRLQAARKGIMSEADWSKLTMALHTDRSASDATLRHLWENVLKPHKNVLVKPPEPPRNPLVPPMPRSAEEMQARREEVRRQNSERAKKGAATKAAKQAANGEAEPIPTAT